MTFRATLVTDGTSDVVLVPVLEWLMRQLTPEEFEIRWADPRAFPEATHNLAEKLAAAFREYPCQLLFVHRDAERQPPQVRCQEIGASNITRASSETCFQLSPTPAADRTTRRSTAWRVMPSTT